MTELFRHGSPGHPRISVFLRALERQILARLSKKWVSHEWLWTRFHPSLARLSPRWPGSLCQPAAKCPKAGCFASSTASFNVSSFGACRSAHSNGREQAAGKGYVRATFARRAARLRTPPPRSNPARLNLPARLPVAVRPSPPAHAMCRCSGWWRRRRRLAHARRTARFVTAYAASPPRARPPVEPAHRPNRPPARACPSPLKPRPTVSSRLVAKATCGPLSLGAQHDLVRRRPAPIPSPPA